MEELRYLSVGYLVFMALIVFEALYGYLRGRHVYRIGELVVNVGHGMVFQVADAFSKTLVMLPFVTLAAISAEFSAFSLPVDSAWAWLVGVLAYDFCTYWRHRHHHEINFLWAVHGAHHAAEDFNLGAALRQALFGNVLGWLWTLPLALFMPVPMFVGIIVFDYLYQFVQHTRHVPKLGPLEWLFNTPSHHRVHHGTEAHYLDRNYGGIFIVWDRLFRTFQVEQQEPTYGITKPLGTLNPVWANLAFFADLRAAMRRVQRSGDAWKLWLAGPGDVERLAPGGPTRPRAPLENASIPPVIKRYVLAQFGLCVGPLLALIWTDPSVVWLRVGLGAVTIAGAVACGGFLERKPWRARLEAGRLTLTAVLLTGAVWLDPAALWPAVAALSAVLFGAALLGLPLLAAGPADDLTTAKWPDVRTTE